MKLVNLVLALAGLVMAAAAPIKFPDEWGEPPAIMTMDYRPLPGGYGHGSSTLASWIEDNMVKDKKERGKGVLMPRTSPGIPVEG